MFTLNALLCGEITCPQMKHYLYSFSLLFAVLLMGAQAFAQTGTIRGKVVDGSNGEALLGSTVRLMSDGAVKGGAYTDLEGAYTIKAAPGTYQLLTSYFSYITDTSEIVVTEGSIETVQTLMFPEMSVREDLEVTITAKTSAASDVAFLAKKQSAINSIDGVTFDLVQRTGDASVAAAMSRVTGVTVEGGKYVYVRGLGDRYSKTILNGAELPGLDPNRNSVQMDIFPSNLIDNVLVYKNFTPDLPGSFSGGLINVVTKDFPDRFQLKVSLSTSFNPQANLRDDFLTYETGSTDWRAVDDGTRAIPEFVENLEDGIPALSFTDPEIAGQIDQAANSFETRMYQIPGSSPLGQNYQISVGNQYLLGGRPLGFIANISYRRSISAYDEGTVGRYKNTGTAANPNTTLNKERLLSDVNSASDEVLWGGLFKLSYKPGDHHKLSFNLMHNQSGESTVKYLRGGIPEDAPDLFYQTRVLGYLQRSLTVYQLQGQHAFGPLKADWIGSYTQSSQQEPDLRFFSTDYTFDGTDTIHAIQVNLYPAPSRFFRDLTEENMDFKLNFELPFMQWSDLEAKVKFGGAYTSKDRQFIERRYELSTETGATPYQGDIVAFTSPENTGIARIDTNIFNGQPFYTIQYANIYQDASEDRNRYTGSQVIQAGYAMIDLPLTTRLKFVGGARYEGTQATTISGEIDSVTVESDTIYVQGNLDLNDILPAASFIFAANEKMNFRAGYSRTLARPTFREFSPFVSFDFAGDFLLTGNPNLDRTLIDNYDLRWDWFLGLNELLSFSVFYKDFTNPIEKVIPVQAASTEFTYRNIESATVYGVELEFRKNFEFISPALRYLQVGGNLALIKSVVQIPDDIFSKIASVDPFRENTRPLYGQSPYSFNMELAYVNPENGWTVSTSYNQFGPRIVLVGGTNPDVYEQPRGLLNFSLSKRLPMGFSVRLRANNLLNPRYLQTMEYQGTSYTFNEYRVGRSFSLGLSYSIN